MKSKLAKGLGIGFGIGVSMYLTGLFFEKKEIKAKLKEREAFGTGENWQ
ncbi:hypothetical protein [Anaerobacillus alkaliphilus]|nr:hypothetical protein [Anaerobacillus alkaliphilus]